MEFAEELRQAFGMSMVATKALAERLSAEIERRVLTHDDIHAAGGPSSPTLTKILRGDGEPITDKTAKKLEAAFGWPRGTAVTVAQGDDWSPDLGRQAAAVVSDQLNPALAEFTDYELVAEVSTRMLLMAARLHAHGDEALSFVTDPETGRNVVTSRPAR